MPLVMVTESISIEKVFNISRQLSLTDQLLLISWLSERVRQEMDQISEPIDMLSLVGLDAELWRTVDVDAYLDQERAGWDH